MKGKGKKQACKKKNRCGREGIKTERPEIARQEGLDDGLASSVEEITDLADNIVPLGGQTIVLVEKTTISSNATSPLTKTGRTV